MDNTFYNEKIFNTISDSSDDEESETEDYTETRYSNMTKKKSYEKYRNKLFTPDIVKKKIVVDSHNYYQADTNFNTSNFDVHFDFERKSGDSSSSLVTTNYDIYNNVISFKLLKTTIRTPPYNVNRTNNIIKYKVLGGENPDKIHSITINPGQYEVDEMADVFQMYNKRYQESDEGNKNKNIKDNYSHYVEYSDPMVNALNITQETIASKAETPRTFLVNFLQTDETNMNLPETERDRPLKGLINKIEYFGNEGEENEVIILWDYDNITRGAARLFGFLPKETRSQQLGNEKIPTFYSNRLLDVSTHFVDLVIPEIPSISCKRNSSGRDIIERIQLRAGHGEYLHYRTAEADLQPVYFTPIKLHRINIQLWAQNNELYDTNNSDVSFEFEITMLKNINIVR